MNSGPQYVPEIERRQCVRRIDFHEQPIEFFGFRTVPHLLGSMGPIEQVIGIVAGVVNCEGELSVLVRATARLLDLNVAERGEIGRDRC